MVGGGEPTFGSGVGVRGFRGSEALVLEHQRPASAPPARHSRPHAVKRVGRRAESGHTWGALGLGFCRSTRSDGSGMGGPPKVFWSTRSLQCESALGGERLCSELGSLRMADTAVEGVILRASGHGVQRTRLTGQEWELWSSAENELDSDFYLHSEASESLSRRNL